jgi:hypothetical protein
MRSTAGDRVLLICFWICASVAVAAAFVLGLGHRDRDPGIATPENFGYVAFAAAFAAGLVFRVKGVAAVVVAALVHGLALVLGDAALGDVGDTATGSLIAIYVVGLPLVLMLAAGIGAGLGTLVNAQRARRQ